MSVPSRGGGWLEEREFFGLGVLPFDNPAVGSYIQCFARRGAGCAVQLDRGRVFRTGVGRRRMRPLSNRQRVEPMLSAGFAATFFDNSVVVKVASLCVNRAGATQFAPDLVPRAL